MAYLIGDRKVYVHVTKESWGKDTDATEHSVEKGNPLVDHIKPGSPTLSLTGVITGTNYKAIRTILNKWQDSGRTLRYIGDGIYTSCYIASLSTDKTKDIANGLSFSMDLKKFRIAKSSYTKKKAKSKKNATTSAGTQSVEKNSTTTTQSYTVKAGDTIYALLNGPYASCSKTAQEIMDANPGAFSKKGDFRTLQIGARLKF